MIGDDSPPDDFEEEKDAPRLVLPNGDNTPRGRLYSFCKFRTNLEENIYKIGREYLINTSPSLSSLSILLINLF